MSLEEWAEWATHPGTVKYKEALKIWIEDLKSQWEIGRFAGGKTLYQNSLADAQARGQIDILRKLEELDHDQFCEIFNDDE